MHYLRQADPEWSKVPLGHHNPANTKAPTLGKYGCFVTALTMAVNHLTGYMYTPKEIQERILSKRPDAFFGVQLVLERAAPVFGLVAEEKNRIRTVRGDKRLPPAARMALETGLCILHVDHDGELPLGDPQGDHFILGYLLANGKIECADPATGGPVYLDPVTLKGTAKWGKVAKQYAVVSTIPIRKAV